MEPELRQLIRGCKDKTEGSKIVAAYIREAKGTDTLIDQVLLMRKRRETGAQKPDRRPPPPPRTPTAEKIRRLEPPPRKKDPTPKPATPSPEPEPIRSPTPPPKEKTKKKVKKKLPKPSPPDSPTPLRTYSPNPNAQVKSKRRFSDFDHYESDDSDDSKPDPAAKENERRPKPATKQNKNNSKKTAPPPSSSEDESSDSQGDDSKPVKTPARKETIPAKSVKNAPETPVRKPSSTPAQKPPPTLVQKATKPTKSNSLKRKSKKPVAKGTFENFNESDETDDSESESESESDDTSSDETLPVSKKTTAQDSKSNSDSKPDSSSRSKSEKLSAKDPNSKKEQTKVKRRMKANGEFENYSGSEEREQDGGQSSKEITEENQATRDQVTEKKTSSGEQKQEMTGATKNQGSPTDSILEGSSKTADARNSNPSAPPEKERDALQSKNNDQSALSQTENGDLSNNGAEAKKVRWNANVASPTPTIRRKKKRNKSAKRKAANDADSKITEEPEDSKKAEEDFSTIGDERANIADNSVALTGAAISVKSSKRESDEDESGQTTEKKEQKHLILTAGDDRPATAESRLTEPLHPSTLSATSRRSVRELDLQAQPTVDRERSELEGQLDMMDKIESLSIGDPNEQESTMNAQMTATADTAATAATTATTPTAKRQDKVGENSSEKRSLSPYKVLPNIEKTAAEQARSKVAMKDSKRPDSNNSLVVYAKPHKKARVKTDLGPYLDTLEALTDSSLQYVIAKHGLQMGLEQPISVAKARQSLLKQEKKAESLDPKVVNRLQHGAYAKRLEKFLNKK